MGVVDLLLGVGLTVAVGVGMTLATSGHSRIEFWVARLSFGLAAALIAGAYSYWRNEKARSHSSQLMLGIVGAAAITAGMPLTIWWVDLREREALQPQPATSVIGRVIAVSENPPPAPGASRPSPKLSTAPSILPRQTENLAPVLPTLGENKPAAPTSERLDVKLSMDEDQLTSIDGPVTINATFLNYGTKTGFYWVRAIRLIYKDETLSGGGLARDLFYSIVKGSGLDLIVSTNESERVGKINNLDGEYDVSNVSSSDVGFTPQTQFKEIAAGQSLDAHFHFKFSPINFSTYNAAIYGIAFQIYGPKQPHLLVCPVAFISRQLPVPQGAMSYGSITAGLQKLLPAADVSPICVPVDN